MGGYNGENGKCIPISPVTAKGPVNLTPATGKPPVDFGSGRLGNVTEKSQPPVDEAWRNKFYWQRRGDES